MPLSVSKLGHQYIQRTGRQYRRWQTKIDEAPKWLKESDLRRASKEDIPVIWDSQTMLDFLRVDDVAVIRAGLSLTYGGSSQLIDLHIKPSVIEFVESVCSQWMNKSRISVKQLHGIRNVLTKTPQVAEYLARQAEMRRADR